MTPITDQVLFEAWLIPGVCVGILFAIESYWDFKDWREKRKKEELERRAKKKSTRARI